MIAYLRQQLTINGHCLLLVQLVTTVSRTFHIQKNNKNTQKMTLKFKLQVFNN